MVAIVRFVVGMEVESGMQLTRACGKLLKLPKFSAFGLTCQAKRHSPCPGSVGHSKVAGRQFIGTSGTSFQVPPGRCAKT